MAVMTQNEMRMLVNGGSIMDDRSMDIRDAYMAQIAVAALGETKTPLLEALNSYADELERSMENVTFLHKDRHATAVAHIAWLRSF